MNLKLYHNQIHQHPPPKYVEATKLSNPPAGLALATEGIKKIAVVKKTVAKISFNFIG